MAKIKWKIVSGNRVKRWKRSESESGCRWHKRVPPHWYRKYLNRKERSRFKKAILNGKEHCFPFMKREASYYW